MKINLQLAAIFLFLVLFYNKSLLAENVYVDLIKIYNFSIFSWTKQLVLHSKIQVKQYFLE